jgi:hypothetical protein
MRRELILLAAACGCPFHVTAQDPAVIERAAASITAEDMYRRIGVMAHDSMLGRYTPSPGLDQTASYIAAEFGRLGLEPGGDNGSFIQRYPLITTQLAVDASTIAVRGGPTWKVGRDVLVRFGTISDPVSGPVVVVDGSVGGLEPLERANLAGAIVLIASPSGLSTRQLSQLVFARGAAAMISISDRTESSWTAMSARQGRPSMRKAWGESTESRRGVFLEISEDAVAPALRQYGYDLRPAQTRARQRISVKRLPNMVVSIDLQYAPVDQQFAPNVVGILEGSDPVLKSEYVLFSAHMDHVGVGSPVNGDSIFNGADDDASGTAAVIETAEAYAMLSPRPKRSMIFLAVSGEERGLWGSEYFAANPSVQIDRIVADFNSDMISRNWEDTVVVIGKEHSDLGQTLNRVNAEHPELSMHAIDDIWPEERFYFRSDHIHFARRGVPILFFFTGTHEDYHQVTDELQKVNSSKAARIARLVFHVGLEVANNPERPKWDPQSYNQIVELVP